VSRRPVYNSHFTGNYTYAFRRNFDIRIGAKIQDGGQFCQQFF